MARRSFRRARRPSRRAPADRRHGGCRAVRATLCRRRPPLPLLHAQSRGAELRDLSPARRQGQTMTVSQTLRAEAAKRILIKDGAYGTSIQDRKLKSDEYCGGLDLMKDQRGNNDLLNLTRPDVVRSICESFADAGAEILATNTFNANAISQADYGAEALVTRINVEAARITREVAERDGKQRWVAGALGPTNKTLSLSPNVNDPAFREVDFD